MAGYCWRTRKCRNLCLPHAFLEGKKAWETDTRKSTTRTLKLIRQQYLAVFVPLFHWTDLCLAARGRVYYATRSSPDPPAERDELRTRRERLARSRPRLPAA